MNLVNLHDPATISPLIKLDTAQTEADWQPLYLFNLYRLTVSSVFLGLFLADIAPSFLGGFDGRLFVIVSWFYSGFAILCEYLIRHRWFQFDTQVLGQVIIDLFALTLLMHASGGVNSGLGMLLVITVAGGSLLTEGRTAFFFAAVASLCVLIQVTLADIYTWFGQTSYTHAGMLGVTFFATAFLAFSLAKRVRINETLAKQRGEHLRYLAQLNAQIVQQIESGIVVMDAMGHIRLFNEAAKRLVGLKEQPNGRTLKSILPDLAEQLRNWQIAQIKTPIPFKPTQGEVELILTFTALHQGRDRSVLIVLEDATLMHRRAEQLKLASLGRLTASIAHEIRNPLGAVSHAAQLLSELPQLSTSQQRLTKIIIDHSQRIDTIVKNILQLSRRGPAQTQLFDLRMWLTTFLEDFIPQHALNSEDILIHVPNVPTLICFDPMQLAQVVNNLCENGLRHSRRQGQRVQLPPFLELTVAHCEKPYLDVLDHGRGINETIKGQIFEPFFTTESGGTGLGLYISKEICTANQASLHLFSNTSEGCCFRIHFSSAEANPDFSN